MAIIMLPFLHSAFLLFLIAVCLSSASPVELDFPSSNGQTKNENLTLCNKIIPGLDRMARGIDITKFDLYTDDVLHSGYGKVVLNFSCNSNQKWTHPNNPSTQYNRPDQISGADPIPASKLTIKASFNQNMTDYKRSIGVKVGIDIEGGSGKDAGAFSAGASYDNVQEDLLISNKSVGEVSVEVSSMMLDFNSPETLLLSDDFQTYIDHKLPARCSDNPPLYAKFIRDYGTHYFDSALFGGYLQQRSSIENDFVMHSTDIKVKENMAISFMNLFNISNSNEFDRKNEDKTFHTKSERVFAYFGGLGEWMQENPNSGQLSTWTKTVNQNPWLLSGKLKPLDDLVLNSTLKAQVQTAIQLHQLNARLSEIKRAIRLTNDFPLTISETALLEKTQKLINSCDNTDIVNVHKGLNQLSSVVKPMTREFAVKLKKGVEYTYGSTYQCLVAYAYRPCPVNISTETIAQATRWVNIQNLYQGGKFDQLEGMREAIQNGRQYLESDSTFVADLCPPVPLVPLQQCKECVVKAFENHICTYPSDKVQQMYERYVAELKQTVTTIKSI